MRRRTILLTSAAGMALAIVLLFAPLADSERIIMAPDPSSFANALQFNLGQLSYVPVTQAGHSSLAYLWFGVGASASYQPSNRCDVPGFVCSYVPTSTYPDVFLALNDTRPIPKVDISQVRLRLNQSDFVTIVVTFTLRNDGAAAVQPFVVLNGTLLSSAYAPIDNPGQSIAYKVVVYPSTVPKIGDHFFVEIRVSSTGLGASWWTYAHVED